MKRLPIPGRRALVAVGLTAAFAVPLAVFSGVVHGASKKQVTIENSDGNLVEFEINGKTKIMLGKRRISPEALKTGDEVTIEARQELAEYLVAVTITVRATSKS